MLNYLKKIPYFSKKLIKLKVKLRKEFNYIIYVYLKLKKI